MREGETRRAFKVHPAIWPASGIFLLVLFNAISDVLTDGGPGLFGQGAFLHIGLREGVPSGALVAVLEYGGALAITAIGMMPVIATRGVDLSIGSIMAITGAVAAQMAASGWNGWMAVTAGLGAGAICGAWNGLLVSGLRLQPFVATLVLMVSGRGIAQMVTEGQITNFRDPVIEYVGLGRPGAFPLPMPFLLGAALLLLTALVMRRTAVGLFIESIGGNPTAARLSGVRERGITFAAYVFCGLCAGLSGLIAAASIKAADPFSAGRNQELGAIFAVVVGGTSLAGGRMCIGGAFIGAFLMQCLTTTMYARNVGPDIAPLPQAIVILLVCVLSSTSLRTAWKNLRRGAKRSGLSP